MNPFVELCKLMLYLFVLAAVLAYIVGLLIIIVISIIYFCGYLCDLIDGKWVNKFGILVSKKLPKIKDYKIAKKIWIMMQPKEMYLRYETPLCSFCLSYSAISVLYSLLPSKFGVTVQYLIASCIYLVCYFIGMSKRCGMDTEYYDRVLKNNLAFLKLSFLPITFLITVLGFIFSVPGFKVPDMDFISYYKMIIDVTKSSGDTNVFSISLKLLLIGILLLVLLYVISLPIQLVSFFIIIVIQYFKEYGKSYKELIKRYIDIVIYLLRQ